MPEHACVRERCRVPRGLLCLWPGASSGEVALRFSKRGFSLPLPCVAVCPVAASVQVGRGV